MNTLTEEERKELDRQVADNEIIAELETLDLSSVDKSYIFTNSKGKVKQWITKIIEQESGVSLGSDVVDDVEEGVGNPSEPVDKVEQMLAKAEQKLRRRKK
jgi:ribonuclease HII